MGYIMLGHGGLVVRSDAASVEMGTVAIPQGTTIQFYSDTGQGLYYGSAHLDVWAQLQTPWPALDSTKVTWNLTLQGAPELWTDELKNNPSFGGHTLIRPGVDGVPDPIKMCSGTKATCPTDPRQVAGGAKHKCDGILGAYVGDLYWLACTSVVRGDKAVVAAALGTAPEGVLIGEDPDTAHELQAGPTVLGLPADVATEVDTRNYDVLKSLDDGDETYYYQAGKAVLIGDGHATAAVQYIGSINYVEGTIRIKKGGVLSAGKLYVSKCPDQQVFEAAIARISDKTVEFE